MALAHRVIAVSIAAAMPAVVFLVSGNVAIEFIVLGAIVGVAYWYLGPAGTLL